MNLLEICSLCISEWTSKHCSTLAYQASELTDNADILQFNAIVGIQMDLQ